MPLNNRSIALLFIFCLLVFSTAASSDGYFPLPFVKQESVPQAAKTGSVVYRIGNHGELAVTVNSYWKSTTTKEQQFATIKALNISDQGTTVWEYTFNNCYDIRSTFDTAPDNKGRWLAVAVCTTSTSDKSPVVALDAFTGAQVWLKEVDIMQYNSVIMGVGIIGMIDSSTKAVLRLNLEDGASLPAIPAVGTYSATFFRTRFPDCADDVASSYFRQGIKTTADGTFLLYSRGDGYLLNLAKPTMKRLVEHANSGAILFAPYPSWTSSSTTPALVGLISSRTKTDHSVSPSTTTTAFNVTVFDTNTQKSLWTHIVSDPTYSTVYDVSLHVGNHSISANPTVLLAAQHSLFKITGSSVTQRKPLESPFSGGRNVEGGVHYLNYGTSSAQVFTQDSAGSTQLFDLITDATIWSSVGQFGRCNQRNIVLRLSANPGDNAIGDYLVGCVGYGSNYYTAFSITTGEVSYQAQTIKCNEPMATNDGVIVARDDTDTNIYFVNSLWFLPTINSLEQRTNLNALIIDGITYMLYTSDLRRNYMTAVTPEGRFLWSVPLPPGTISSTVKPFAFREFIVAIINNAELVFLDQLTGKATYTLSISEKCVYTTSSVGGIGAMSVFDTPGQPREMFMVAGSSTQGCLLHFDSDLEVTSTTLPPGSYLNYYSEHLSISVVKESILIIGNNKLFVFDRSTFKLRWSVDAQYAEVVTLPNAAFLVTYKTVQAFRLQDGLLLWSHRLSSSAMGAPFLRANILYLALYSGGMFAFRTEVQLPLEEPRVKWNFDPATLPGSSSSGSSKSSSASAVGNLVLYFTGTHLHALHYNTGVVQYSIPIGSSCSAISSTSPVMSLTKTNVADTFDGYILVDCNAEQTILLNPFTGKSLISVPSGAVTAAKYSNNLLLALQSPPSTMGASLSAILSDDDQATIKIPSIPKNTPLVIPSKVIPPTDAPTALPDDPALSTTYAHPFVAWTGPETHGRTKSVFVGGDIAVQFSSSSRTLMASAHDATKYGSTLWEIVVATGSRYLDPQWADYVGNNLVAVTTPTTINVLNVQSGEIVWNTTCKHFSTYPSPVYIPAKDVLVVPGSDDYKVFAFDISDGKNHTFKMDEMPGYSTYTDYIQEMRFDTVNNNLLVSTDFRDSETYTQYTYLAAYEIETQTQVWNISDVHKSNTLFSLVPGTNKMLWVQNNDSQTVKVATIDTKTGEAIGTAYQTTEKYRIVPLQVLGAVQPLTNDLFAILITKHEVYAFKNHQQLWSYQDSERYSDSHTGESKIMFQHNLVIVQSAFKIFALSLDSGTNLWNVTKSRSSSGSNQPLKIAAAPAVGPDMYILGMEDIALINITSGKITWKRVGRFPIEDVRIITFTPPARKSRSAVAFSSKCSYTCNPLMVIELEQTALAAPGYIHVADGSGGLISADYVSTTEESIPFIMRFSSAGDLLWRKSLAENNSPSMLVTFSNNKYVASFSYYDVTIFDVSNGDALTTHKFTDLCPRSGQSSFSIYLPQDQQNVVHVSEDVYVRANANCFVKILGSTRNVTAITTEAGLPSDTTLFLPIPNLAIFLDGDNSVMTAYSTDTMKKLWSQQFHFVFFSTSSIIADPQHKVLFFGTRNVVVAVEASTGVVAWRYLISKADDAPFSQQVRIRGPVYFDDSIFIAEDFRGVSRLNISLDVGNVTSGREVWTTKIPVNSNEESPTIISGPVISKEYGIILVSTYYSVVAFDWKDGSVKWSQQMSSCQQLDILSTCIVAMCDGFYVLDLFSGNTVTSLFTDSLASFIQNRVNTKFPFALYWTDGRNSFKNQIPDRFFTAPPPLVQQAPFVPYTLPAGYKAPPLPAQSLPVVEQLQPATMVPIESQVVSPMLNLTYSGSSHGAAVNANGYSLLVGLGEVYSSVSDVFGVEMESKKISWRVRNVCRGRRAGGVIPWSSSEAGVFCDRYSTTANILRIFDLKTGNNSKNVSLPRNTRIPSSSQVRASVLNLPSTTCFTVSLPTAYYYQTKYTPTVICFDVDTAAPKWNVSFASPNSNYYPAQLYANGDRLTIIWPILNYQTSPVTSVQLSTGHVNWQLDDETSSFVRSSLDSTGAYIATGATKDDQGGYYVFSVYDAATGGLVAHYKNDTFDKNFNIRTMQVIKIANQPTYVVATTGSAVHCFTLGGSSATLHWSVATETSSPSMAAADGNLYIRSAYGAISSVALSTGAEQFTVVAPSLPSFDMAVRLSSSKVLLTGSSLTLLDTKEKSISWLFRSSTYGDPVLLKNSYGTVTQLLVATSQSTSLRWLDVKRAGWAYSSAQLNSRATVLENEVFVSHASKLYSFDATSGNPLWTSTVSERPANQYFPPTIVGSDFIVSAGMNTDIGLFFKSNGTLLQKYDIKDCQEGDYYSPTMLVSSVGNSLFVTFGRPCVYVIDTTGATLLNPPALQELMFDFKVYGNPTAGPSGIGLIFDDFDVLHAVQNGKVIWNTTLPYTATQLQVSYYGNFIYAADLNIIYCIDATDGKILWSEAQLASQIISPPVGYNGHLYVGTTNGLAKLAIGFEEQSSRLVWEADVTAFVSEMSSGSYLATSPHPLVTKHGLLVTESNNVMFATDTATARIVWARADCNQPLLAGDRLFAFCDGTSLIDLATGNQVANLGSGTSSASASSSTMATTTQRKVLAIPLNGFNENVQLPVVPVDPEPTNTVPQGYTLPPPATLPTSVPDGQFIPDLECVSRVQYQHQQFQKCVNNMIADIYSADRSAPVDCGDAAQKLIMCRNFYFLAVTHHCPAGIALYEDFASSLRKSESFNFCDNSDKCSKSGESSNVCNALRIPDQWTPAPASPIVVPDFSFSVAPIEATFPPTPSPATPSPKASSPDDDRTHYHKKHTAVIGIAIVGALVAIGVLVGLVRFAQTRKRSSLGDGEDWREDNLQEAMVSSPSPAELM